MLRRGRRQAGAEEDHQADRPLEGRTEDEEIQASDVRGPRAEELPEGEQNTHPPVELCVQSQAAGEVLDGKTKGDGFFNDVAVFMILTLLALTQSVERSLWGAFDILTESDDTKLGPGDTDC